MNALTTILEFFLKLAVITAAVFAIYFVVGCTRDLELAQKAKAVPQEINLRLHLNGTK